VNPLADASFTRYTDFPGEELDAAISPDGQFILFLANREGVFEGWLSQMGSGEFVNVTNGRIPALLNDEIRNLGFSADGRMWFRQDRTDSMGLRVSAGTMAQAVIGGDLRRLLDRGIEPVWSPDGSQLLYHDPAPGDPIFIADRNGRNPRQIYAAAPGVHCHYLVWSPDAQYVYFVSGIPPEELDLWRVPASGGDAEKLTNHNGSVAYPTFIDARTVLYRATANNGSGPWLYALDVATRQSRRVSLGVEQYLSIAAAGDGRRLVAAVANPEGGLWSVPIGASVAREAQAERVTVPTVTARAPRVGADALFYLSFKEGSRGLWRLASGNATELWRPTDGALLVPPAIGPGGKQLALTVRSGIRSHLFLMSIEGTDLRPLAPALEVRDPPSWSPDGQWLTVAVGDALVKVPVNGGEPVRLVEGLVRLPVWSPDGRFILYSEALQGGGYFVKAVTPDGTAFPVPPLWVRRGGDRYRMLPDGRRVVYISGDFGRQDFWMLDLMTGDRRQLTDLQPGFSIRGFDVSPDGSRIVFDRVRENSDVVLIQLPASPTGAD
jgi:Tol biopolymer transport system component